MVALNTPSMDLSFAAQDFHLKGMDEKFYTLKNCVGEKGLLLMFICNHCPYVRSIIKKLVQDAKDLEIFGIKSVAIMPNDTVDYPDDSYDNMVGFARENHLTFPYLLDETQDVARAYGAVCTPDFFGFNNKLSLCYRGRFDPSGKSDIDNQQSERELFCAMKFIAETGALVLNQKPSIGCSIKWRSV